MFVAPDQLDILTAQNIQGTPALVIRSPLALHPHARPGGQAPALRAHRCAGYWLVDPDLNAVTVYQRIDGGAFPVVAHLTADKHDTLETPLITEWSVPLTRLFR